MRPLLRLRNVNATTPHPLDSKYSIMVHIQAFQGLYQFQPWACLTALISHLHGDKILAWFLVHPEGHHFHALCVAMTGECGINTFAVWSSWQRLEYLEVLRLGDLDHLMVTLAQLRYASSIIDLASVFAILERTTQWISSLLLPANSFHTCNIISAGGSRFCSSLWPWFLKLDFARIRPWLGI